MGRLSDYFAHQAAQADGSEAVIGGMGLTGGPTAAFGTAKILGQVHQTIGLHQAMGLLPLLGAALVIVLFIASRTVRGDYWKLQAWMKGRAKGPEAG